MNICVVSHEEQYQHSLEKDGHFGAVIWRQDVVKDMQVDHLLLVGDAVDHRDLKEIRSMYPHIPIFYKIESVHNMVLMKNIEMVCNAHNIIPIDENCTTLQTAQKISHHLFVAEAKGQARVVSFFGTHSGAGVSTTIFNTAYALSKKVEEKILVLSLNPWDPGDIFLDYQGKYLNDLKIDMKTGSMDEETLLDAVYHYEHGFAHMAGNRDIKMQRFYQPSEIDRLIEVARLCYDVILIDGGAHFDNACYAQSFIQSDLKFLVTTQEEKGYRGYWPYVFQQLIEPLQGSANDFMLILNQFTSDVSLITEKDIQEELEMSLLATIPDQEALGNIAISQKNLLYDMAERHYQQAVQMIADAIIERGQLTVLEGESEQEGGIWKSLFGSKKKVM